MLRSRTIPSTAMQKPTLRETKNDDIAVLVEMMREFYAEADFPLDAARAQTVFAELQRSPLLGRAYLVRVGDEEVGYLVLTFTFSMEYGGRVGFLDDFYVRDHFRNRGVGTAALAAARDVARGVGLRALHVDVGRDSAAAQTVYRRAGFEENDRQLLTLKLAAATHERAERQE